MVNTIVLYGNWLLKQNIIKWNVNYRNDQGIWCIDDFVQQSLKT